MENDPISALRNSSAAKIQESPLDVLIVGGGIVGAGIARDAAMRGLRTGLIDQHDFAFGTSSRSTRLLHGGMRYLAQGRLGLVHEASTEKCTIHQIAPHLSDPLAFIFPTYRGTEWPLWKLRIGVKLYDLLCGRRNLGSSSWMNSREIQACLPGLTPQSLTGAVRYFDGFTNDARLVMDSLRSAAKHGAIPCNYTRLETAEPGANGWQCVIRDVLADRPGKIQARCVINATGPWADQLQHGQVNLRLTKGVHLVIDRSRLSIPDAVVLTEGSRILFAIPWNERVILGTTDTDYQGKPESVRTSQEDIQYILSVINTCFPHAHLVEKDVISSWAGLRPLIADPNGKPSDISRAHQILMPKPGWIDVTGGKLTTYRLMGEQTVDLIFRHLHRSSPPCRTAGELLVPKDEAEGISSTIPPPVTRKAVEHYVRKEWAVSLCDVLVRRSGWHYYVKNQEETVRQVADWMSEISGWPADRRQKELENYRTATR